jgi:hypothetical protein
MKQDTAVSKIQTGEIEEYDDFLLQATSKPPSAIVSDVSVPSLPVQITYTANSDSCPGIQYNNCTVNMFAAPQPPFSPYTMYPPYPGPYSRFN